MADLFLALGLVSFIVVLGITAMNGFGKFRSDSHWLTYLLPACAITAIFIVLYAIYD